MSNKVLFLDLDGTVRRSKSGATFINDPYDQEMIPGVENAIARYTDYKIIGVTNQGGVKAGFKSLEDCFTEQKITLDLIPRMLMIFFCTDGGETFYRLSKFAREVGQSPLLSNRWEDFGNFRKPNPGMLNFGISLYPGHEYLMVGDREEDRQAAVAANVNFIDAKEWRNEK